MLASSEHRIIIGHVNLSKNSFCPLGHITNSSETLGCSFDENSIAPAVLLCSVFKLCFLNSLPLHV